MGVTIQLAGKTTWSVALQEIVELDRRHAVLSRDIVSVDKRFADRSGPCG